MGVGDDRSRAARARDVRLAYERYRRSPRRRRAWAADNPGNVAMRSELARAIERLAAAQLTGGGAVLDAGCGGGYWLERLASRGVAPSRLHGIDLIDRRVEQAQARTPGAAVAEGDLTALPYAAERFDLVLLLTVLSSLPDEGAVADALREVRRVLAPGGLALVYEPRVPTPANRRTRRIRPHDVAAIVGPIEALETVTLAPPLARRLGPRAASLYPRLSVVPVLRTHWAGSFRVERGR